MKIQVSIRSEAVDGKNVVCVDVERGDNRPYCLARRGFCPQGVLVRFGPGNSPVSWGEIRRMIREADGDSFELRRSRRQDFTFLSARRAFEANGLTFGESDYLSLRVVDGGGYYTNLALLLSDQCPYSVKCAVIDDTGQEYQFLNRQECAGSVFEQLERASLFLDTANRLRSSVEGYVRVDAREYPERAVRETLLNCMVHCDYESNAGDAREGILRSHDVRLGRRLARGLDPQPHDAGHVGSPQPPSRADIPAPRPRRGLGRRRSLRGRRVCVVWPRANLRAECDGLFS